MTRSRHGIAATLGVLAASWAGAVAAETAYSAEGGTDSFLKLLSERLEFTVQQIPALGRHLARLPEIIDGRTALLLLGIVVASLAAEYVVRLLLSRARLKGFDRLVGHSPLRAFGRALLLDLLALVALAVAGRLVLAQIGDPQSVGGRLGQDVLQAVLYWRSFNLLFRAWLRPAAPEGRIAPVDTDAARGLLIALCLVWVVWHWRHEMTAWLSAMVSERKLGYRLKLDAARRWWVLGLVFYGLMGLAAIYAALTESNTAARGLGRIESRPAPSARRR